MLTELYIEALLADEEMADQVWELWHVGLIPDQVVALAWSQTVAQSLAISRSMPYSWRGIIRKSIRLTWDSSNEITNQFVLVIRNGAG